MKDTDLESVSEIKTAITAAQGQPCQLSSDGRLTDRREVVGWSDLGVVRCQASKFGTFLRKTLPQTFHLLFSCHCRLPLPQRFLERRDNFVEIRFARETWVDCTEAETRQPEMYRVGSRNEVTSILPSNRIKFSAQRDFHWLQRPKCSFILCERCLLLVNQERFSSWKYCTMSWRDFATAIYSSNAVKWVKVPLILLEYTFELLINTAPPACW